ncbi:MAG: GTP-binding protein [Hyphomicrobiales bacterium]|nr:GTP-binding protein [Hyphomicrobiales bacterium]
MTLLVNDLTDPAAIARDAVLYEHEHKSLLRFIACGSVDHGKSSLLGRLLFDAGLVPDDQIETLRKDTGRLTGPEDTLDFSLLFDGLAAEREQKITIDLAYRFFATRKRKFIVADAPGHEQYTRNMATGASTAELALLLINAQSGLTQQTRRHALIAATLGVRHLVVAVNKMDIIGYSKDSFAAIERDFRDFAERLGDVELTFIPVSAKKGDNVVHRSKAMDWYRGPTLLEKLETVDATPRASETPFRMAVQWVSRPTADFRGYCGLIAGGDVVPGLEIVVQPSGQRTRIKEIITANGVLDRAGIGQSVTLTLTEDVDASRGDIIADATAPATVSDRFDARIFWMGQGTLAPGGRYHIKLGTAKAAARIAGPIKLIDLADDAALKPADSLLNNEFGLCTLELDRPLAADRYDDNRDTGSFILIDAETLDTVAMGLIEGATSSAPNKTVSSKIEERTHLFGTPRKRRSFAKAVIWRTAGSVATFAIAYYITGNAHLAASITAAEITVKFALYYFHERAWALVPWGRR